jgi:alpha-beta hydrolase superfamily lysophospholipase
VFITGTALWWLMMSVPQRFSPLRGAITGILVGFLSYPVVALITEFVQRNWPAIADFAAFETRTRNALLTTGLAIMTSGWATVIIMALVGLAINWVLLRLHPGAAAVEVKRRAKQRPLPRGWLWAASALAAIVIASLVATFTYLTVTPIDVAGLVNRPSPTMPAKTYDEALAAFQKVQQRDAGFELHDRCHSTLLTHGDKTARVVVYFHGLTSCPAQADVVAQRLFDAGYNVYLPRMYAHGMADPMTLAMADLTAEHMVDLANESVDMAQGLGDEVIVIGLSAGGTIVSWVAQNRGDVNNAIAVSPFFGPHVVPPWASTAANNLMLMLPSIMMWWNPLETVRPEDMNYAYARYSTRSLAETMRLGRVVQSAANTTPPAAKRIGMVLNDADVAISQALADGVISAWRSHGAEVIVNVLPLSRRLPHDLLDAREPVGDIELVYSILIEMTQ